MIYFLTEFFHNYPHLKYSFRLFERFLTSAKLQKTAVWFLRRCVEEQIIPPSLKLRNFYNFNNEPFPIVYYHIIFNRISYLRRNINSLFSSTNRLFHKLRASLPSHIFKQIIDRAYNQASASATRNKNHLKSKLFNIFKNSPWCKFSRPQNIQNLSSRSLSFHERIILGYGLGFALLPNHSDTISYL